jgi:5-methylcytosine-specific restriction protein A
LSDGGRDTVDNAVALCPNCHRECHHGKDVAGLRASLLRVAQGLGEV